MMSPAPSRLTVLVATLVTSAWAGNALYAVGEPGGALKFWSSALVAAAMIWFAAMHALRSYGRRGTLHFVLIVFTVGWLAETVSIFTGVPFGRYHYTDVMSPFVGHVSVFVMPAYGLMGYVCWSLGRLICGVSNDRFRRGHGARVPIVAAALMVTWDLSLDPLRATVENRWIWIGGGPYFGVPLSNFAGWFVVTWAMFQTFAVVASRMPATPSRPAAQDRMLWTGMALMYCAFPVEYLLNGILVAAGRSTGDAAADQVHVAVALICAVTMVPVTIFCLGRVQAAFGTVRAAPDRGDSRYVRSER